MSKHIEKLKKQLLEISEVVNSFKSEAVQVKIVDRLLDAMMETDRAEGDGVETFGKRNYKVRNGEEVNYSSAKSARKPGATKILNQLLTSDFFDTPHSISSIANY